MLPPAVLDTTFCTGGNDGGGGRKLGVIGATCPATGTIAKVLPGGAALPASAGADDAGSGDADDTAVDVPVAATAAAVTAVAASFARASAACMPVLMVSSKAANSLSKVDIWTKAASTSAFLLATSRGSNGFSKHSWKLLCIVLTAFPYLADLTLLARPIRDCGFRFAIFRFLRGAGEFWHAAH